MNYECTKPVTLFSEDYSFAELSMLLVILSDRENLKKHQPNHPSEFLMIIIMTLFIPPKWI